MASAAAQSPALSVSPRVMSAGSLQRITWTFTIPAGGTQRGGGVRIEIPVAYAETEFLLWSAPQLEDSAGPGFVRTRASNGARPTVAIDGLLRGIVEATFSAPLPAGTMVVIAYHGQVQSIAGSVEARHGFRRDGASPWVTAAHAPTFSIAPARAALVQVRHASNLTLGEPFAVTLVALDRFGNLATQYDGALALSSADGSATLPQRVRFTAADSGRVVVRNARFGTAGFQSVMATDSSRRVRTAHHYAWVSEGAPFTRHLFGDLHFHTGTGAANTGFFTNSAQADANTTGTNTFKQLNLAGDHRANFTNARAAYAYARDVIGLDFASTSEHDAPLNTPAVWSASQDVSDAYYAPGRFTTFYGFEWTPDLDHSVVMYASRDGRVFDHETYSSFSALRQALEAQRVPALAIPHVSWLFPNHVQWDDTASAFRRVGEIYSLWNSRHLVQPDDEPQLFELGPADRWSYQYAWQKGFRLGLIGASDNHLGHPGADNISVQVRHSGGLAVVLADTNNRANVWSALNARTTYATTGTRIYVDFSADDHPMGSEYATSGTPRFAIKVGGTNTLASVEVVKLAEGRYETVFEAKPARETFEGEFIDTTFVAPAMYYLRVRQVEEYPGRLYSHATAEMAWSSPIWIGKGSAGSGGQ